MHHMLRAEGAARTPGGLPPGRGRAKTTIQFYCIRAEQRLRFDLYAGETSVCVFTPRRF